MMLVCLFATPVFSQTTMQDSLSVFFQSLERDTTRAVYSLTEQDSTPYFSPVISPDSVQVAERDTFRPDSNKALWFAALCPGLGQLYNRRYWKLPIVTGGIAGVAYAISWNDRYYKAYTSAYRDIIDSDPNTNYYEDILPSGYSYTTSQLTTVLKNRQQSFRRQRDMSIIVGVAWYLICILDAYVDAELFDFEVNDDLSIQLERTQPIQPLSPSFGSYGGAYNGLDISCSFRF